MNDRVGWTEGQRRGDPGGNGECLRSRRPINKEQPPRIKTKRAGGFKKAAVGSTVPCR